MRGYRAWLIRGIFAAGILMLLCHAGSQLKKVRRLERLGIYELNMPIKAEEAEKILEEADSYGTGTYSHNIIFFTEQKKKTVEHTQWHRLTETDVVSLCGDSTLLFPYGYPLEPGDQKGCLLGEETAVALFGGRKVIGEQIAYEGEIYEIRGILQGRDLFVIQAGEKTSLGNAGIFKDTAPERENTAAWLQNACGFLLEEIPFRFYETIVRVKIVVLGMILYSWAGALLCRLLSAGRKGREAKSPEGIKTVKKTVIAAGVLLAVFGMVYVMNFNAYTMPDKISDLSWWGNYFGGEWTKWKQFLGREEMFLQEEFGKCIGIL